MPLSDLSPHRREECREIKYNSNLVAYSLTTGLLLYFMLCHVSDVSSNLHSTTIL
jgi:hypothetical protein